MTDTLTTDRASLEVAQLAALRRLIAALQTNPFYQPRLAQAGIDDNIADLSTFTARMPLTTKDELIADQCHHPPFGTDLTFPLARYTRYHQTSATTGAPLRWLDTPESWGALLRIWRRVYEAAGVNDEDRIFFAFSFGPFLGFWTAFEAATQLGALAIPGGGMSSAARLRAIFDNRATVLCCTPTYAIRLAEAAVEANIDLSASPVRRIIVAGEIGGSVPATRDIIEQHWRGARVFDHHGMTEVGPVSYENPSHRGILHIVEEAFLPELIDPQTRQALDWRNAVQPVTGELVLTTLMRIASPLLRYRTGDMVRISPLSAKQLGTSEMPLDGGILARSDDMLIVRGVNVYPSAVDQIIRQHSDVAEYQVHVTTQRGMTELSLRIEPVPACADPARLCDQVREALRSALQLRIAVTATDLNELPRYEMKARRWIRP